eukprot:9659035-Karenia_brevis.AAC.1
MEVNYLGHMFVFNRPRFIEEIQLAPEDLRRDLVSLAVKHPPDRSMKNTSRSEYEDWYFSAVSEACEWQYKVPDDDDDEES